MLLFFCRNFALANTKRVSISPARQQGEKNPLNMVLQLVLQGHKIK